VAIDVGPEGFPSPDEIEGFWAFDKMHAPRPITPLSEALVTQPLAEGFTTAQAMYDSPVAVTNRHVNYYMYASFHPLHDADELADRLTRYRQTLADKVPGVGLRWETEWKPAIIEGNLEERDADYSELDDEALIAKLADMKEKMTFRWHVHGHINFVLISSSKFCDVYDEIVQPDDPTEAYQCLQGWETRSVESSRGLWRLSRLVRAEPELVELFASTAPGDLPAALEATETGRTFLGELRAYLDDFGWRSDAVYDLGDVTWREDPSIPLGALASYVKLDEGADPEVLFQKAVATRERLLGAARERLADDPERLAEFDELYEAARYSNPLTEDHAFWIDQMWIAIFRRFVLHIGDRLTERGQLAEPSDVFYLTEDELIDAVRAGTDRRDVTARRRAEHRAWATVEPPPALGTPPEPAEDPFMDALTVRLLGITPPDDSPHDPDVLKGVAGSPGTYSGTVKVVRSLTEASVLAEGDVMVCEMTLPPWVPLFSIVGAVVTDTGGVLSHCAIVAREFGLPAVVGTEVGTSALEDGMTVTVDGTKGVVTIDARP
jgi:phosphohistidine swiveling domain-containing protein